MRHFEGDHLERLKIITNIIHDQEPHQKKCKSLPIAAHMSFSCYTPSNCLDLWLSYSFSFCRNTFVISCNLFCIAATRVRTYSWCDRITGSSSGACGTRVSKRASLSLLAPDRASGAAYQRCCHWINPPLPKMERTVLRGTSCCCFALSASTISL